MLNEHPQIMCDTVITDSPSTMPHSGQSPILICVQVVDTLISGTEIPL